MAAQQPCKLSCAAKDARVRYFTNKSSRAARYLVHNSLLLRLVSSAPCPTAASNMLLLWITALHCCLSGPTCNTTVPAYGACGGNASNCKGCQCKDAPWDGYCCQPGHQCNRKKPEYWKCEPAVLQCKPYTGPKCYLTVTAYATCGGLASGCSSCQCKDAPWDGYCCPAGFSCNKQNPLFWKCEKKGTAGASGNQTLAANETTMPTANGTIRVTVKRSAGP